MHGVIVIDKPRGVTSAKVVAKVKHALGAKRAGHTGTLDPMATGVLPVCVGEGTKIAGYLTAADKAYEGTFRLGIETDTLDAEGQVVARHDVAGIGQKDVECAMSALRGDIQQVPPMYSAVKHKGRRLHELARRGDTVERQPRAVRVDRFELLGFDGTDVQFRVVCSKGTYVRVLGQDLGQALGCGAYMTELRRTRSGAFEIASAVALGDLDDGSSPVNVLSPDACLDHLPRVSVPWERAREVRNGVRLSFEALTSGAPPGGPLAMLTEAGDLLAVARVEDGRLRYERVFTYGLDGREQFLQATRPKGLKET